MGKQLRILVIIPKINTTKIAVFLHKTCIYKQIITHEQTFSNDKLSLDETVSFRTKKIMDELFNSGINVSKVDAVSTIGGMLKPIEGGTYYVTDAMIADLKQNYSGKHISNLGAIIANEIATELNVAAYVVDPPVVHEFNKEAIYTGVPEIKRQSIFHALNQKAVARLAADELEKEYDDVNIIVCHIGIGITIGAHKRGKVIDVNNGLHGDGPFSIERAGTLPVQSLLALAYSSEHSEEELMDKLSFKSGLKAYFNVEQIDDVIHILQHNNTQYEEVVKAMTYQIAKEIGAMAAILHGDVDGIALTGQLAAINTITNLIIKRVSWISDIFIYPGEYDLQALHEGTLRVLRREERAKYYT